VGQKRKRGGVMLDQQRCRGGRVSVAREIGDRRAFHSSGAASNMSVTCAPDERAEASDMENGSQRPTLSYDKAKMQVSGKGFFIALAGQRTRDELHKIFFYQDDHINFYFFAERERWVRVPGPNSVGEVEDTEIYAISGMWRADLGLVARKDIAEDAKVIARENVLAGLMLMEEYCYKPPKKVLIRYE
jgi:hypothetical protein